MESFCVLKSAQGQRRNRGVIKPDIGKKYKNLPWRRFIQLLAIARNMALSGKGPMFGAADVLPIASREICVRIKEAGAKNRHQADFFGPHPDNPEIQPSYMNHFRWWRFSTTRTYTPLRSSPFHQGHVLVRTYPTHRRNRLFVVQTPPLTGPGPVEAAVLRCDVS